MTRTAVLALLKEALGPVFDTLVGRIKRIEAHAAETERRSAQRVQRLEERQAASTGLRYLGTHDPGEVYESGDGVTHGGSLWVARARTSTKPGTDATWTLAVKHGRDGRDARGAA